MDARGGIYSRERERGLVAASLAERVSWFRKLGLREHRQVVVRVETHVRVDVIGGGCGVMGGKGNISRGTRALRKVKLTIFPWIASYVRVSLLIDSNRGYSERGRVNELAVLFMREKKGRRERRGKRVRRKKN